MSRSIDNPIEINPQTAVQASASAEEAVISPCVGVCALDADDMCIGCYRTGEEITYWGRYTQAEKRQVMERVGQREQADSNFIPLG